MAAQSVTVFGGTGFLGRCIVHHLQAAGFGVRAASRHPDSGGSLFAAPGVEPVRADINDESSVAAAAAGAFAVVNAVSLYIEHGRDTFQSVHVEAAARVATIATRAGAKRLVHISGIGADADSASSYIRSRGQGEAAVLLAFPSATLIRPAVMFGREDAFLVPLLSMLRRLPIFPMFGTGKTRLQPAYVEDVAEAVGRVLQIAAAHNVYELAGPRVYTYRELLQTIAAQAGRRPLLVPFPIPLWRLIGSISEFLPNPPITANQVDLMELDSVAASDISGFGALQIVPQAIETILPAVLQDEKQDAAGGSSAS
jgi:uncharacterized protein YbjT (DUF2867 family)